MKEGSSREIPDEVLKERFGNLTEEELEEVRSELLAEGFEAEDDLRIHKALEERAACSSGNRAPMFALSLPSAIQALICSAALRSSIGVPLNITNPCRLHSFT